MDPSDKDKPHELVRGEFVEKFLFEEYSSLRSEINNHLQDRKKLDGQVLAGIFAIYVWILTRSDQVLLELVRIALFMPPILCALGFLKWVAIMKKMFSAAEYILQIEKIILKDTSYVGWEHYILRKRRNRPIVGQMEGWVESIFWLVTFVTTITISYIALDRIGSTETLGFGKNRGHETNLTSGLLDGRTDVAHEYAACEKFRIVGSARLN